MRRAYAVTASTLRDHPFRVIVSQAMCRRYFAGYGISLVGSWAQMTAVSWLTWQISHSPLALGGNGAMMAIPALVVSPWSGALADRWDRRRYLLALQGVSAVLVAGFAAILWSGTLALWHCNVLALLLGLVLTLEQPARRAYLGDILTMGELRPALAVTSALNNLSKLIGAALAGLALAHFGAVSVTLANMVSFALAAWGIAGTRSHQVRHLVHEPPLRGMANAARTVWATPLLRLLLVLSVAFTMFHLSLQVLYPALADQVLGGDAALLGRLVAAAGAGALLGVIVVSPLVVRTRHVGRLVLGMLSWGALWSVVTACSRSVAVTTLAVAAGGAVVPLMGMAVLAAFHEGVPQTMRSRADAFWMMCAFGVQPVAALGVGAMSAAWGVPAAFAVAATALLACVAWGWSQIPQVPQAPAVVERPPEHRPGARGAAER